MTDKFTSKGSADYFIEQRGYANTFLEKIDMLINWNSPHRCPRCRTGSENTIESRIRVELQGNLF